MTPKPSILDLFRTDEHHFWDPNSHYSPEDPDDEEGRIRKAFREHPAFRVKVSKAAHVFYNKYHRPPEMPPLEEMIRFLEDYPADQYRHATIPARLAHKSISSAKSLVGIVFRSLTGVKQIVKVSCANCQNGCFSPRIEVEDLETPENDLKDVEAIVVTEETSSEE